MVLKPFCPRLRPELRLHPQQRWLRDPLTRLELALDPGSLAVVQALDGTRGPAELAQQAGLSRGAVETVLRRLLLLHLLEGAGQETVETLRALQAGNHELPFSVLREGRFACQGSGACCRSYGRCELDDDDLATISSLDLGSALPELAGTPWFEALPTSGGVRKFLASRNGVCVFLLESGLCGLHAAFGEAVKPKVCRLYPYTVLHTVIGVKVYDQGECARFATSSRSGPPVSEELERIQELVGPTRTLYHPVVRAGSQLHFDFGIFLRLQKELVGRIARAPLTAVACLLQAARLQRSLFDALAGCPLQVGQPEKLVQTVLAADCPAVAPTKAALAAGAQACAGLCDQLREVLHSSLHDPETPLRRGMRAQIEGSLEVLAALGQRATSKAADALLSGPELPSGPKLPSGPELDALFRISFRQTLFGDFAMVQERPRAGLLRLALGFLLSLQAMAGRSTDPLQHFDAGHSLALRVLRRHELDGVFVAFEEHVWDVFEALPELVA